MPLHRGRSADVSVTPLGWILLALAAVTMAVLVFGPRETEAPALVFAAILLLAIVRGISAERFGADRRGPPAISRFGLLSTAVAKDSSQSGASRVIPAEPLSEADEIDQDLMLLQERLRREAAGRT
jgi:hypothetical protein